MAMVIFDTDVDKAFEAGFFFRFLSQSKFWMEKVRMEFIYLLTCFYKGDMNNHQFKEKKKITKI